MGSVCGGTERESLTRCIKTSRPVSGAYVPVLLFLLLSFSWAGAIPFFSSMAKVRRLPSGLCQSAGGSSPSQ